MNYYMEPFIDLFREQGLAEARSIAIRNHPELPDDDYGLFEMYCTDPTCDCRRVLIFIYAEHFRLGHPLATLTYAFDPDDEYPGLAIDPFNPQTEYSGALVDLVASHMESDPAFVRRLESHYRQVKEAVADPRHPIHEKARRAAAPRPVKRRRKKRHR